MTATAWAMSTRSQLMAAEKPKCWLEDLSQKHLLGLFLVFARFTPAWSQPCDTIAGCRGIIDAHLERAKDKPWLWKKVIMMRTGTDGQEVAGFLSMEGPTPFGLLIYVEVRKDFWGRGIATGAFRAFRSLYWRQTREAPRSELWSSDRWHTAAGKGIPNEMVKIGTVSGMVSHGEKAALVAMTRAGCRCIPIAAPEQQEPVASALTSLMESSPRVDPAAWVQFGDDFSTAKTQELVRGSEPASEEGTTTSQCKRGPWTPNEDTPASLRVRGPGNSSRRFAGPINTEQYEQARQAQARHHNRVQQLRRDHGVPQRDQAGAQRWRRPQPPSYSGTQKIQTVTDAWNDLMRRAKRPTSGLDP